MKNPFLTASIVIGLSVLLFSCAEEDHRSKEVKKMEVTGSAEMEVIPDEIYMTFTLKEYKKNGKKVALDAVKTEFLALCKSAGIADSNISTAAYAGNEQWDYWWWYNRRHNQDFISTISYTVMASTAPELDQIVAGLTDDAMQHFYVSKTSHSNLENLRKEVKTKALVASKDKAMYLAQSIGEQVGTALHIQEVDDDLYSDIAATGNAMNKMALEQSNYGFDSNQSNTNAPQFEKIKLRYEVKCVFELK
jgi:uncharacterized protein